MLNQEEPRVRLVVQEIDPVLRVQQVKKAIGLSKATIYRYIEKDLFPRPLQLGPGAVGWRQSTIDDWLASRETA